MTTILIAFILAFLIALVATQMAMGIALRFKILDYPDGNRKAHKKPMPYLGGVAIYFAMLAPIAGLTLLPELMISEQIQAYQGKLWGLLAGSSMALSLGLIDDILSLRARWKLVWQILIGICIYHFGFKIDSVTNPLGGQIHFGVFAFPITVFWFVACMNAVNLLDGMDGLAAGTCLFVGITLFNTSLQFSNTFGMLLMACFCGAILGFLFFNFPPAKIFLGDSGSLLLGFLVAAMSLMGVGARKAEAAVALFIPVVALGLPILDTSMAIFRRWFHKLPISSPDKSHIHHILMSMGYTPRRTVLLLYLICVALGGIALVITVVQRNEIVILLIGGLIVTVYVCVRIFAGVRLHDVMTRLTEDSTHRARWTAASTHLAHIVLHEDKIDNLADIWELAKPVFLAMDLEMATLTLTGKEEEYSWKHHGGKVLADDTDDFWSADIKLQRDSNIIGHLKITKNTSRTSFLRETPEILESLKSNMERLIS